MFPPRCLSIGWSGWEMVDSYASPTMMDLARLLNPSDQVQKELVRARQRKGFIRGIGRLCFAEAQRQVTALSRRGSKTPGHRRRPGPRAPSRVRDLPSISYVDQGTAYHGAAVRATAPRARALYTARAVQTGARRPADRATASPAGGATCTGCDR